MAVTLRELLPPEYRSRRPAGGSAEDKAFNRTRAGLINKIAEAEGVARRTIERRVTETGSQKRGQTEKGLSQKATAAVRKFFRETPLEEEKGKGNAFDPNKQDRILAQFATNDREAAERQLAEWEGDSEQGESGTESAPLEAHAQQLEIRYVPVGSSYREYNRSTKSYDSYTAPEGGTYLVQMRGN